MPDVWIVSGAGTPAANGTYQYIGEYVEDPYIDTYPAYENENGLKLFFQRAGFLSWVIAGGFESEYPSWEAFYQSVLYRTGVAPEIYPNAWGWSNVNCAGASPAPTIDSSVVIAAPVHLANVGRTISAELSVTNYPAVNGYIRLTLDGYIGTEHYEVQRHHNNVPLPTGENQQIILSPWSIGADYPDGDYELTAEVWLSGYPSRYSISAPITVTLESPPTPYLQIEEPPADRVRYGRSFPIRVGYGAFVTDPATADGLEVLLFPPASSGLDTIIVRTGAYAFGTSGTVDLTAEIPEGYPSGTYTIKARATLASATAVSSADVEITRRTHLAAAGVNVEIAGDMLPLDNAVVLQGAGEAATSGQVALQIEAVLAGAGEALTVGEIVVAHGLLGAGEAHTGGAAVMEATPQTILADLHGEANTEGAAVLQSTPQVLLEGLTGEAHTEGTAVIERELQGQGAARTSGRVEMSKYLMPPGGEAHTEGAAAIGRALMVAGSAATEGDADLARAFTVHGAVRTAGEVQLAHALTGAGEARTRGNAALGHGLIVAGQANATGATLISRVLRGLSGAARTAGEALLGHGLLAAGTARTAGAALLRRGVSLAGATATSGTAILAHGLQAQGAAQATGEAAVAHGVKGAGRTTTSGSCQLAHGVGGAGNARTSGRGAIGRVLVVVGAAETTGEAQIALDLIGAGAAQATGDADLRRGLAGAGVAWSAGAAQIALQLPVDGEAGATGECLLAHGPAGIGMANTAGTVALQVWLAVRNRGVARTSGQVLLVRGTAGTDGTARTSGRVTLAHGLPEANGVAQTSGDAALQLLLSGAGRVRTAGEIVLAHGLCGAGAARTSGRVKLAHSLSGKGEAGTAGEARLNHLLPAIEPGQARTLGEAVLLIAPGLWSPLPRRHMDVRMDRAEQNIDLRVRGLHVGRETAVMELL